MEKVAFNNYYELSYDAAKNWVHWKMKGFWSSMAVVPDFEKDWNMIQSKVKPGFKILADISTFKVMEDDVKTAQDRRQEKLMQAGCKKLASVVANTVTKISMNEALQGSGMDKILKYCTSQKEAEDFLNAN
jgi:hypothetical protein